MIKILPITLIPLFFFTFYFNVIFLTDSNLPEMKNLEVETQSEKKLIINENESKITIVNENKNQVELKNNIKSNNLSENLEKTERKKKVDNENLSKNNIIKDKNNIKKQIRIQFGAFKSEKNIANLEGKLVKIFKKEFGDEFGSFLVLKDKKHFKLILNTNSIVDAKKICNFSKKNNINCLIIN